MHVLPTPFLRPTPLRIKGTLSLWHSHRTLMVSTDGAYRPGAIGGGIIFYAPGVGLLATVSFGCPVLGCTSVHAEWYAKIVALHLLGDWAGTLVFLSDATAIQQRSYTTYPPKQTPLETLYRLAAPLLSRCTVRELWHRAAHDITEQELNFALNRLAHAAATAGLSDPTPLSLPLLHLLPQRVLLSYGEQVVLDTAQGLDEVYSQSVQDQYFERWHPASLRPTASEFLQLLEQGSLSAQVVKRAFALRTLFLHPPPQPVHPPRVPLLWRSCT